MLSNEVNLSGRAPIILSIYLMKFCLKSNIMWEKCLLWLFVIHLHMQVTTESIIESFSPDFNKLIESLFLQKDNEKTMLSADLTTLRPDFKNDANLYCELKRFYMAEFQMINHCQKSIKS